MPYSPERVKALLAFATPQEQAAINAILEAVLWWPMEGPQSMAYYSVADVVGYGGAAGGGKTDLAIGKAITQHEIAAIFRREGTELTAIEDRFRKVLGSDDGYNGQKKIWRPPKVPGLQIEFGSVPNIGDETKYQGRPKDLLVLDEASNFLESQVRFLMGWVRTTNPKQRTQTLMCFNPPTTAEGRWIIDYFAPWLSKTHPNPAMPGELRWFAMLNGVETEVLDSTPFTHDGLLIKPQSRTFIPAKIADNPYLLGTNYMATLQALPEPLRSQMLLGDFNAGMEDSEWQVIPTAWVEGAQARWKALLPKPRMDGMGVDVARGGKDNTVISRRHGEWYDELLAYPATATPDGPTVAGLTIAAMRDAAPIHIDAIGVGASPFDFLNQARQQVIGVIASEASRSTDKSGRLTFKNYRSQLVWQFRELLDPANNHNVALPPDRRLLVDLCAFTWELKGREIYVASREEIIAKIGRSPDYATAVILASIPTPRVKDLPGHDVRPDAPHDPYKQPSMGAGTNRQSEQPHDPYR